MGRHKDGFEWFDLSNYEAVKKFNAQDWSLTIEMRMLFCKSTTDDSGEFIECNTKNLSKIGGAALTAWQTIKLVGANVFSEWETKRDRTNDAKYGAEIAAAIAKYGHDSLNSVTDLTADHALTLLGTQYDQNELLEDISTLFGITPGVSYLEKYAHPLNHDDTGLVKVNLRSSDEQIKQNFESWLKKARHSLLKSRASRISQKDFDEWEAAKVVACFDLLTISEIEGLHLSNHHLGDLLFPDELNVDVAERVRKITRPKTQRVFSEETVQVLFSQELEGFKAE